MTAARARRARTRSPRSVDDSALGDQPLVLVGEESEIAPVRSALSDLRVSIIVASDIDAAMRMDGVAGFVLVDLERTHKLDEAVASLVGVQRGPVFVVVGDHRSGKTIRALYAGGAAAIFEWPLESLLLARYVAEVLALRLVHGRAKRPDAALARTVRAHLKLLPGLNEIPKVSAKDGLVRLSGSVDSYRLKRDIERCVSGVPGVRVSDVSEISVIAPRVSDQELKKAARRLLDVCADPESANLVARVRDGVITIEGTAATARVVRILADRAAGIAGLRDLELRITVSKQAHSSSRNTARRVSENLATFFPDQHVRVSFFVGTAVLTGETSTLAQRKAIADFVADDDEVHRVVDKMDVTPT